MTCGSIPHQEQKVEHGIFAGLKVIDCASFIAAPAAATVLSDFGAEVIKIEPPGRGDPYRALPEIPGNPSGPHNYAWLLESRNKKSIALDLTKPDARAVLHRLVADADVFITNYPPPVRQRLGITYDDIGPLNARLIYASFTGYGEAGEEAHRPGFDSNAWWARSGLMDVVRPHAGAPPARSVAGMGDHPSAIALYAAIVTALYRRERTGQGGHVGSSLMANGAWANGVFIQAQLCGSTFYPRQPRENALNALTNHYLCRDQRWLMLSLLDQQRQWPRLAACIGRPELVDDPRFATAPARQTHARELIAILDAVFATQDLAAWRAVLDANDLVTGAVATLDDVPGDRQMLANEVLVPFENDTMLTVSSPFWVARADKVKPRRPPELGEHSDEVLRAAGYADADIARLRASGAVG
jgi:crotonobetainyl-CoA:carnitine CoA-transferase CaiB-like acyl-CoA transferase